MDVVFVRQGEYERGEKAYPLIRETASLYAMECMDITSSADLILPDVRKTEKGKPYLVWPDHDELDHIGISVTHSGDIWMCAFSEGCCGLDFQYVRSGPGESSIPERFFTEGERRYLENGGNFFDIWVRREALGKYAGDGWFGDYPDSCPEGRPAEKILIGGKEVFVHDLTESLTNDAADEPSKADFERSYRAVLISGSEEAPLIRTI